MLTLVLQLFQWSFGSCSWCNYNIGGRHGFPCTGMVILMMILSQLLVYQGRLPLKSYIVTLIPLSNQCGLFKCNISYGSWPLKLNELLGKHLVKNYIGFDILFGTLGIKIVY